MSLFLFFKVQCLSGHLSAGCEVADDVDYIGEVQIRPGQFVSWRKGMDKGTQSIMGKNRRLKMGVKARKGEVKEEGSMASLEFTCLQRTGHPWQSNISPAW